MKTTDCRQTQREIDSNELNQQLSENSMAHITGCSTCHEVLERSSSVRNLMASLGSVSAPADFDMKLRGRLAAERSSRVTWINFLRQTPGVPAIAFAFVLLVVITLAVFMRSSNPSEIAEVPLPTAPSVASNEQVTGGVKPALGTNSSVEVPVPEDPAPGIRSDSPRKAAKPHTRLASFTNSPRLGSREYSVGAAESVKGNGIANPTSPVVSLSAPAQPVVVSLRDNNGATRTISLPPVSFGSQRLGYQSETLASSGKGAW